jgi:hypothetical protein
MQQRGGKERASALHDKSLMNACATWQTPPRLKIKSLLSLSLILFNLLLWQTAKLSRPKPTSAFRAHLKDRIIQTFSVLI